MESDLWQIITSRSLLFCICFEILNVNLVVGFAERGDTVPDVAPSRRMLVFFHIYLDYNYDISDHEVKRHQLGSFHLVVLLF